MVLKLMKSWIIVTIKIFEACTFSVKPELVLTDGYPIKGCNGLNKCIVKGS